LAHLRECPACAALWDEQRRLAAGLRTASSETRHIEAPKRVEARVVAAFRSHAGLMAAQPIGRPPSLWIPIAACAAAAAALIVLALLLVNWRQPQAPRRAPSGIELAALQETDESPYAGGDFLPLPNAARIAPNEDVNLVRVEVPRSAMIGLGFEVSAERAAEPVEAEVVLGSDGLARAVRFLDE
jgi:hypothetical protein